MTRVLLLPEEEIRKILDYFGVRKFFKAKHKTQKP